MSAEAQATYKELLKRLLKLREENNDQDFPEEDGILDELDVAWWDMTDDEQDDVELWIEESYPDGSDQI